MENTDNEIKEKVYDHQSLKHLIDLQKNIVLDRQVEDVVFFVVAQN